MNGTLRLFRVSALIFLICALVATLLVSLSLTLPKLPSMDLTRAQFNETGELSGVLSIVNTTGSEGFTEIRFGVWSACYYTANDTQRMCLPLDIGYKVTIQLTNGNETNSIAVKAGLTRMLVVHPIGAVVTLIAMPLKHLNGTRILGIILPILSFMVVLVALGIDGAFFWNLKSHVKELDAGTNARVSFQIGFWVWLVALITIKLAIIVLFWGRHAAHSEAKTGAMNTWPSYRKGMQTFFQVNQLQ